MLIDSHAHIHDEKFDDDREDVIGRSFDGGMDAIITIGTNEKTSHDAIAVAREYESVYATVALHPLHLFDAYTDSEEGEIIEEFDYDKYLALAQDEDVVAIGEVGLDYHHFNEMHDIERIKKLQKQVFTEFVRIAGEVKKPLIIHCWDGYDDVLEILRQNPLCPTDISPLERGRGCLGVIHSFIGSWKTAQKFYDLGFKIGLNGIITYSESYNKLIRNSSINDILIETDCPYLTPAPLERTSRNEPLNVKYVAKKIAEVKKITVEEVIEITSKNTKELFDI